MSDITSCGRSGPSRLSSCSSTASSREVALDELDAGDGVHRQDVQRDDAALAPAAASRRTGSSRRAQRPDRRSVMPGRRIAVGALDLLQLEHRARAIARLARALHVRRRSRVPAASGWLDLVRLGMQPNRLEKLTEKQKKYLRGLAHGRDPVVLIGQAGLSPAVAERARDRARRSRAGESARPRRRSRPARRHPRRAGRADAQRAGAAHRQRRRVLPPAQGQADASSCRPIELAAPAASAPSARREEQHGRDAVQHAEARHVVRGARARSIIGPRTSSLTSGAAAVAAISQRRLSRAASDLRASAARTISIARDDDAEPCLDVKQPCRPAARPACRSSSDREQRRRDDARRSVHRLPAQSVTRKRRASSEACVPHTYCTAMISYERVPFGATTSTTSPCDLPTSARAIGEDTEISPLLMSASASPTIW